MSIKQIVFLDIDGTITNGEKQISKLTRTVLKELDQREDILLVLISARMPKSLKYICLDLDIPENIISFNGAIGRLTGIENLEIKLLPKNLLPPSLALSCYESCKDYDDMSFNIYTKDSWLTNEKNRWTQREIDNTFLQPDFIGVDSVNLLRLTEREEIYKILVRSNKKNLTAIKDNLFAGKVDCESTMIATRDTIVEITPKNIHKGTAVEKIRNRLGFKSDQMIAFGDADNDIEMITQVKYGYAVGNATESLKKVAYEVIESNLDDGVAKQLIRTFGLKIDL